MKADLPLGWTEITFAELLDVKYGKALRKRDRVEDGPVGVYGSAGLVGHHDLALVDEPAVIVGRKGNAGAVWVSEKPSWPIDTTYFLRVPTNISARFLAYQLENLNLGASDSSTTIPSLRRPDLEAVSVRLPRRADQDRIVAAIEDHFSRLDAVNASLEAAELRCQALVKSILVGAVPNELPPCWRMTTVDKAGETGLGRQRSPKYHSGPNMKPYFRVANVFEDRIDASDIMEMHFEDVDFDKYRLEVGDVLLNEGQSPEFLGRPAIYRGDPPSVAFTNSLIRFVAGPDVTPEWALLVFRRHMHSGRFMKESRITTNIAHLALGRFRSVEFPVPPLEVQDALVAATRAALDSVDRIMEQIRSAATRTNALRRAVLTHAFAGQLVPQSAADERASILPRRIHEAPTGRPPRQKSTP